jgi:Peptidase family M23
MDLAVPNWTPVYAAGAGWATIVNQDPICTTDLGSPHIGNIVSVQHGSGSTATTSTYVHLGSINISNGQWVDQNTQLGTVGNSGRHSSCSFYHLHYEVHPANTYLGTPASVDPGPLTACRSGLAVTYPGALGYSSWDSIPPYVKNVVTDRSCMTGGAAQSNAEVVAQSSGTVDLFWQGSNGDLYHSYFNPGNQWVNAGDMTAGLAHGALASEPSATVSSPGAVYVFWKALDDSQIYYMIRCWWRLVYRAIPACVWIGVLRSPRCWPA